METHDGSWPLDPPTLDERTELKRLAAWFAAGLGTTIAFAAILPQTIETRGATRGMALDRELRQRCLETGCTPEELLAREARFEEPGGPATDPG